ITETLLHDAPIGTRSRAPTSIGSFGVVTVVEPAGAVTMRSTGAAITKPRPPPTAQVATFKNPRRSDSSPIVGYRNRAFDRSARYGPWNTSAHRALFALLILFALDAEGGLRARFEPLLSDGLLTDLADAERAVVDLLEREVQLVEQALLAAAQAELER